MGTMEAFVKRIPPPRFYTNGFYKKYLHALDLLWNQKRRDAVGFITQTIADEIEHEDLSIFYRLWIEVLVESQDRISLQILKNHLAHMAPQFSDYDQWLALRGLVHFELEELEACKLIIRCVASNTYSPYAMELQQRMNLRSSEEGKAELTILSCTAPVTDYCVLEKLAQGLLSNGDADKLPHLLSKISLNFAKAPLPDHFNFWYYFDHNQLSEAIKIGKQLCNSYPDNERYKFDLAYALFCKEETNEAVKLLESFDVKFRKKDVDTLSLLGYGYLLKSKDNTRSQEWEKAKNYFTLAKNQSEKIGVPNNEAILNLNFIKEKESKKISSTSEAKFWVLPLSARREHELMESKENEIDFLFHSLDKNIRNEDYVLFTAPAQTSQRLLAVYKVQKSGLWHPYIKNQGLLERIHRFSKSIYMPSLDIHNEFETVKLSPEQKEAWLNLIEDQIPIRESLKETPAKSYAIQHKKLSHGG